MKFIKTSIYLILTVFLFTLLTTTSGATSLSSWINGYTIHYITTNNNITEFTNITPNDNFTLIQPRQYYENSTIYKNTSVPTAYYLSTTAYPFTFIKNMIADNSTFCNSSNSNSNNVTDLFFYTLCNSYKTAINVSAIDSNSNNSTYLTNAVKTLATEYTADDNFTKELYTLYVNYSQACEKSGTTIQSGLFIYTYCLGSSTNYTLPNPLQFTAFYESLYTFIQFQKNTTSAITKYMLEYDINNQTIFPVINNSELIQPDVAILGVYPGILPSGQSAYNMSNGSTLILPIDMINSTEVSNLSSSYTTITSGVYSNVTVFIGTQNIFNPYAFYNLSDEGYPFNGNESSGYETFDNSCNTNNPGYNNIANKEIASDKNSIYSSLYSDDLYPTNFNVNYATPSQDTYYSDYGPSIIEAQYNNLTSSNEKILYGTETQNGKIIYENETNVTDFYSYTKLYELTIPKSAFPEKNEIIFVKMVSPFSYSMSYSTFTENLQSPKTKYNEYNYTSYKTEIVNETETVDNQTVTYQKQIEIPETCNVYQVSTSINYNSTENSLGTKYYNINETNNRTLSVSTNMTTMNLFKFVNNTLTLNYSYNYNNVKLLNGNYSTNTKITIPLGTAFQILSPNGTALYEFNSYTFDENLITSNYSSYYTSISKYIYAYDPTLVYPNTYLSISALYPTIENSYNNAEYLNQFIGEEVFQPSIIGFINEIEYAPFEILSNLFGNANKDFAESAAINNLGEYKYYTEGCNATRIGDTCTIRNSFYTFGQGTITSARSYDLLNPTLYTQSAFYAGYENNLYLCAKANLLQGNIGGLFSCTTTVDNMSKIFVDTNELNFNTSFFGLNQTYKEEFYDALETASVGNSSYPSFYSAGYSFIQPPTEVNKAYINNATNYTASYNSNGTITIDFNRPFSSLTLDECDYNLCFNKVITPTNSTLNYYYNYTALNSTSYLFYITPKIALSNYTGTTQIKIGIGNKTFEENVPSYFIIGYNASNTTKVEANNTVIAGITIDKITIFKNETIWNELASPPEINVSILPSEFSTSKYEFVGLSQKIKLQFNDIYLKNWIAIVIIFALLDLLYLTGEFDNTLVFLKKVAKKLKYWEE